MREIFLSYARADDEPFVKQLYQDLTENGIDVWWDRKAMESRGRTFLQELRDAIEGSDRLIAVIGPKAVTSDYVRVEWEHALLFAKGVVPVLRCGDYDLVPPELSKFHCPDFRKEQPHQDSLEELIGILAEPVPPLGALRTEVHSLPPHFLPRRDELILLGNAVLADVQRPETVTSAKQKTVIVGMGGMGKSVLAAAFARSTETRRAFTDGVAWISIGQNPDILSNLRQLGLAFNDKIENYVDLKTARDKLPGVLADKVCMIVLDDIWNVAHAEPFINAIGPRCRLLITTRDGGIASALEANEHRLGVLSDAAALRFLANWCDEEVGSLPHEAVSVAKECGNLPFALALCGAMERDGTSWPDMLDALKEADLTFIEKKFPNYPYTDVLKSLKISVDALESEYPEAVKHYQNLVVFHSHKKIPEAAIITLWTHTDKLKERNARKLLTTLNNKALLTLEGETPQRFVTLHDLQHDYLRAIEGDQDKLHVELLEAYQKKCKDGWSTGPNDGYFFEHLAYHLVESGRKDELWRLLLNFNWIQAKLDATDVNSLITDYDYLPDDHTLGLVQGAVRLSAHILANDKSQLAGQLLGRLQSFQEPEIKSMLEQARTSKKCTWLHPLTASLTPPGGPLIRTLEGHTGPVRAVMVTNDGSRAISASYDSTLKVWDLEIGEHIHTLVGHTGPVNAVAMNNDVTRAISASDDTTLKVWDLEKGNNIHTLKGHTSSVSDVVIIPGETWAISASNDKTLKLWDMETEENICTLEKHSNWINAVAVTPDGMKAISASNDNTLKLWDIEKGKNIRTLKGHTSWVNAVVVTPDGTKAISASSDNTLKIWDLKTGENMHTLQGHSSSVNALAIALDGIRAISASMDTTLKVWDLKTGEQIRTLEGHTDCVNAVTITQGGTIAISASNDSTLKVWDLETEENMSIQEGHNRSVRAIAITPDGTRAISASEDGTLKVWDLETGKNIHTLKKHSGWIRDITVTPDGVRAISASNDNTLKVWDLETGEQIHTLEGHTNPVWSVTITPDGKLAISVSRNSTFKVWDLKTGKNIHTLDGNTTSVTDIVVMNDGNHAILASLDNTLKVWNLKTGDHIYTLKGHTGSVRSVAVTADNNCAISASIDNTLKVWNLKTGDHIRTLKGHTNWVWDVAVTTDGTRTISASEDGTLKVWDLKTGEILSTFNGEGAFYACAVSPDGKIIVAGEVSGRVHFLRLEGVD